MKRIHYVETVIETYKPSFEENLQSLINKYESWEYEVEVQYSIAQNNNGNTTYSALVMAYAYYDRGGYRINR